MTSPPEFSFVGAKIRLLAKILLKLLSSFRESSERVRSSKEEGRLSIYTNPWRESAIVLSTICSMVLW